jgi:hypothetical protein
MHGILIILSSSQASGAHFQRKGITIHAVASLKTKAKVSAYGNIHGWTEA